MAEDKIDMMSMAKGILGKTDILENKDLVTEQQLKQDKIKLLEDVTKGLKDKVGEEKANVVIKDYIEPLLGASLGVKTRSFGKKIEQRGGVWEKITGKDIGVKQLTEVTSQIGEVADQVDGIKSQLDKTTSQFSSLLGRKEITGDKNIDEALVTLEGKMNELKEVKGLTSIDFETGSTTLLKNFNEIIQGGIPETAVTATTATALATETDPSSVETNNTLGLTQDNFKSIVTIYKNEVGDLKGNCLKEVRMVMQNMSDKGLVDLPEDKKYGGWASEAKDFGATLKGYVKNGIPEDWEQKNIEVANLEEKKDNITNITDTVSAMKGDIFAFIMRKGDQAGHACLGARVGNEIWIYDNSFSAGNNLTPEGIKDHGFKFQDYCALRKGKYDFDAVMAIPAKKDQLLAYEQQKYPNGLPTVV